MSAEGIWRLKFFSISQLVIVANLYWARLASVWVAIQLLLITVPMLIVRFQEKDARGRAIPPVRHQPGLLGSSVRYSQAGGRFAVSFGSVLGALSELLWFEGWWHQVGVHTPTQVIVVTASVCCSSWYLVVFVCQRWPDEPKKEPEA